MTEISLNNNDFMCAAKVHFNLQRISTNNFANVLGGIKT